MAELATGKLRELSGGKRSRWGHFAVQNATLILAVLLLIIAIAAFLVFFSLDLHRLPALYSWTSTINNAVPLVFVGVGQGLVVLTRGLDLSVGGTMDVANTLAATHMHSGAGSMLAWSAIVLGVGAGVGLVNGLLIAFGRLQPIVVTIATMSILEGIAERILPQPGGSIPHTFSEALANPNGPLGLVWIAVVLVFWAVLRRTRLGLGFYAIGNDQDAARENGLNVRRIKIAAYMMSGIFAAAAGLFVAASSDGGAASAGNSFLLTSFAAVVLGGISFFGGRGSIVGVICGAGVLTVLVSVLFYAHVSSFYESLYEGIFLIGAVLLGQFIARFAETSAARKARRPGRGHQ